MSRTVLELMNRLRKCLYREPSIRGVLTATTTIAAALGMAVTYFLGSQISWRNTAIVCAAVPALSIILTAFVGLIFCVICIAMKTYDISVQKCQTRSEFKEYFYNFSHRFLRRQYGCFQKIVRMML